MGALSDQPNDGVGVIVVTHNSAAVVAGLLDSLPAGMRGLEWDLVVVDNASTDATVELAAARAPAARLLAMGENAGFAAAVNRGLAELGGSRGALVLNPDVRLEPDCASRMHAWLEREVEPVGRRAPSGTAGRPRVGIVAPRLLDGTGRLLPTLRFEPSVPRALAEASVGVRIAGRRGWGETVLDPGAYARASVADWVSGAALMISPACLARCGRFDESFFLYSEDTEFALRAREHGFATQLAPDAIATHLGGASRTDPELWTMLVRNKVELHRRRHGPARAAAFRIASALRELRFALSGNRPSRGAARALMSPAGGLRSRPRRRR